jgi:hypothetical protein
MHTHTLNSVWECDESPLMKLLWSIHELVWIILTVETSSTESSGVVSRFGQWRMAAHVELVKKDIFKSKIARFRNLSSDITFSWKESLNCFVQFTWTYTSFIVTPPRHSEARDIERGTWNPGSRVAGIHARNRGYKVEPHPKTDSAVLVIVWDSTPHLWGVTAVWNHSLCLQQWWHGQECQSRCLYFTTSVSHCTRYISVAIWSLYFTTSDFQASKSKDQALIFGWQWKFCALELLSCIFRFLLYSQEMMGTTWKKTSFRNSHPK